MSPDDPRHGTFAGYAAHRHDGAPSCTPCRDAAARYQRGREHDALNGRPRARPTIGFRRRVEALQALGWSLNYIAEQLSTTPQTIHTAAFKGKYVTSRRHNELAVLYDELCMTFPDDKHANRRRMIAASKGYVMPLAWDDIDNDPAPVGKERENRGQAPLDDVAIERRLQGDKAVRLTTQERVEAWKRWIDRDLGTLAELERRTGINASRYRKVAA